jgi:CubicO group peptidase (beta-lactamase class C family)
LNRIIGRMASHLLACTALAALATACSDPTSPADSLQEFEERLEARGRLARIPGMTAAISKGQEIVWARGFGFADVATDRPAADTTVYHLASLTKPFAAVMLMQLVNEGKISLDDPVSQYGVNLSSNGTIRVRHLLSHTSEQQPGSVYLYNGDRFSHLDSIFVRADGRTFGSALYARIITPLNLRWIAPNPGSIFFALSGVDPAAYLGNFARGYASDFNRTPIAYPTSFSTAAGLTASAREVLAFSMALDRDALLPADLKTLMFTPVTTTGGQITPYGLGWFSTHYKGVQVLWHYGLWTAISSLIIKVPDRQLTFVLLANSEDLSAPYALGAGHLEQSPWAREFLDAFVTGSAPLP